MVILAKEDLYQVKFASLVADYDRQTLVDLYMPIIGYAGISIYFTLWAEAEKQNLNRAIDHEHLLKAMQMPISNFVDERKKLEALGLLKTSLKKDKGFNFYTYQIFAPKTPEKFFSNTLLYGTLIKYVGEGEASRLKNYYKVYENGVDGEDISVSFASVFNPNLNQTIYKKALDIKKGEILDRLQSKADLEFDFSKFIAFVKSSSQISDAAFTKPILKEIERLAALYGVGEETAAQCFIDCYNPRHASGKRVDFKKLADMFLDENKYPYLARNNATYEEPSQISSGTQLAKKINWMEEVSCKEYLQFKQNYTTPVAADLKLVNDLSANLGLKPGVINAILDYSLAKNNNILNRTYVEKVAASVARENIQTAYDTMVFLSKKRVYRKLKKNNEEIKETPTKAVKINKTNKNEDFDEESWQKMIEEVGGK